MKLPRICLRSTPAAALLGLLSTTLHAHPLHDHDKDGSKIVGYDPAIIPPSTSVLTKPEATAPNPAAIFAPFAPKVRTHWDDRWFYVESDSMPDHPMMIGITAWQQQVPLPQAYAGKNAWQFPLHPQVAANPLSAKTHFFRGAIAIAANGVPIFNPIKNDGHTDTFLAGELDSYGGHAGRGDDYHYHLAPLHLQPVVGADQPVAYALDGYPIYGLTEPDGAAATELDTFNGHATPALGYHYHATDTYPYLNGGFHGEVVERDGQVDPQPRAQGVREALPPLRGAKITDFTAEAGTRFGLTVQTPAGTEHVNYTIEDTGAVTFDFVDSRGTVRTEHYPSRQSAATARPSSKKTVSPSPEVPAAAARQPWIKVHASEMDANTDGTLTREELLAEVTRVFTGYDRDADGRLVPAEYNTSEGVRSAMGGFVKQHAKEIDTNADTTITRDELLTTATRMVSKADTNGDGQLTPDELLLPPGYHATPPEGPLPETKRRK